MKSKRNCSVILIVSVFLMIIQITGCGEEGSLYDMSTQGLTVTTSSRSVEADGLSSVTITAELINVSGQSVPWGTPVHFTTTKGHFSNGAQSISVKTIPGTISQAPQGDCAGGDCCCSGCVCGTATVSLISSTETGVANVTVESLGVTQLVYINFTLPLAPGHPTTISLVAGAESITSDAFTTITATVLDKLGESVLLGIPVTFTTSVGAFGNGQKSETAVITTTAGTASVILFGNGESGTTIVNAVSEGIPSNPVTVTITASESETTPTEPTPTPTPDPTDIPRDDTTTTDTDTTDG